MVHTKTYIFTYFYSQYLVLFTMVPRNTVYCSHQKRTQPGPQNASNRYEGIYEEAQVSIKLRAGDACYS